MRTISVRGRAECSRVPDVAELVCTVRGEDTEYEKAYAALNNALAALYAAFEKEGYRKGDFKTGVFRVNRKKSYVREENVNREVFAGYEFTNVLTLRFPCETERLNRAAHTAANSGATDFSLHFSLKNDDDFKSELLKAACKDAKARAQVIAAACGVQLGAISEIRQDGEARSFAAVRAFAADNAVNIAPEEIRASETVDVVWEIF